MADPIQSSASPGDGMSTMQSRFPHTEAEFADDVRVSFDKNSNKWVLEDEDSGEWEWNDKFAKWVPSV